MTNETQNQTPRNWEEAGKWLDAGELEVDSTELTGPVKWIKATTFSCQSLLSYRRTKPAKVVAREFYINPSSQIGPDVFAAYPAPYSPNSGLIHVIEILPQSEGGEKSEDGGWIKRGEKEPTFPCWYWCPMHEIVVEIKSKYQDGYNWTHWQPKRDANMPERPPKG